MAPQYSETKKRSAVKTITWKVIATAITLITVWLFTGEFYFALEVTAVAAAIGLVSFFVHERIWNRISWGKYEKKRAD